MYSISWILITAKSPTPLKSTPSSAKIGQVNGETRGGGAEGDSGGGGEAKPPASEGKMRTESESGEGPPRDKVREGPVESDEESESDESDFEEEGEEEVPDKLNSNFKQDKVGHVLGPYRTYNPVTSLGNQGPVLQCL